MGAPQAAALHETTRPRRGPARRCRTATEEKNSDDGSMRALEGGVLVPSDGAFVSTKASPVLQKRQAAALQGGYAAKTNEPKKSSMVVLVGIALG